MTPESAIKKAICTYLSYCQDVFFWIQESQGTFSPKTGKFRKKNSKFQRNGIPDISILLKFGSYPPVYVGFEVKTPSGKQSDSQKDFERDLQNFGGFYFIVRSPDDAQQCLAKVRSKIKSLLTI